MPPWTTTSAMHEHYITTWWTSPPTWRSLLRARPTSAFVLHYKNLAELPCPSRIAWHLMTIKSPQKNEYFIGVLNQIQPHHHDYYVTDAKNIDLPDVLNKRSADSYHSIPSYTQPRSTLQSPRTSSTLPRSPTHIHIIQQLIIPFYTSLHYTDRTLRKIRRL